MNTVRISGTSEALLTLKPTEQSLLYLAEAYDGLSQQWRACQDWLTSVLVFSTWQLWWIRRTTSPTNFFSRRVDCGVASQRTEWVQWTVLFEKSADAISSPTHLYFLVEIHRNVSIRQTIFVRRLHIEQRRWSEDWVKFLHTTNSVLFRAQVSAGTFGRAVTVSRPSFPSFWFLSSQWRRLCSKSLGRLVKSSRTVIPPPYTVWVSRQESPPVLFRTG